MQLTLKRQTLFVVVGHRSGIRRRPNLPVRQREIPYRQPCMLMPHRRPNQKLNEHQTENRDDRPLNSAKACLLLSPNFHPVPPTAGNQCNTANQDQKQLSHSTMYEAKVGVDLRNAQPTQNPLCNYKHERRHPQPPHPLSGLREPEPNSQNHGQKAHKRSNQPVGVFLKNSKMTNPTVERHQKHVVTECVWPIWNRHPYTFCRHQSTDPNKNQCRQCYIHCEPVQPRALLQRSRHQKLNKNSKKGEIGQFLNSNRD